MADIIDQDRWGICGFVSVLNGLRDAGQLTKSVKGGTIEMPLEQIQTQLYAEIITYLKYILFTESPFVGEIEAISAVCAPPGTTPRKVDEMIRYLEQRLRSIASAHKGNEAAIGKGMRDLIKEEGGTQEVTIAMTPGALIDYMTWAGVKNATEMKVSKISNTGHDLLANTNSIIGIGEFPGPGVPFNGLKHWIYVDKNGVLNNWGKKTQVTNAMTGTVHFGPWAKAVTHVIRLA